MPLRFHKSLSIFPWLKINLGKKRLSLTIGKSPISVTVSEDDTSLNVGLPGTGLSYKEKVDDKDG